MANNDHVAQLMKGVVVWNKWRDENPDIRPDLYEAYLGGADLSGANLSGADLIEASLHKANLSDANLSDANLVGANLSGANLMGANLSGAKLRDANLSRANLSRTNLSGSDLQRATLVDTDLRGADLTGCRIYGVSAWGVKLDSVKQQNLIITHADEPEITVDNIEVAQFVYLLLHNEKIRDVIDTIGRKGVLLLGRFTEGRLEILERLRAKLRELDFVPMVFNFDKPETKDFTETVRLLAGMSRFVIADITKPKSTPLELQAVIPECMIPFATIIEEGEKPFAMFKDLWIKHKQWVFPPIAYASVEELLRGLDKGIIDPAQERFKELVIERAKEMPVRRMSEIISGAAP
jgi:Pentapeptide repeats (8 copies)